MSHKFTTFKHFIVYDLGDVDEAESKLLETLEWRRSNKIDNLLSSDDWTPPPELRQNVQGKLLAIDHQSGCPIWYMPVGKSDIKGKND